MQFISSDTNIWIDFKTIGKLELPFRLPYTYLMSNDVIDSELLNPPKLKEELLQLGHVGVSVTLEEFYLAQDYGSKYRKLSINDRLALSIAKNRGIILLSGDGPLRKAAALENVTVMGTLAVLDQLLKTDLINDDEYCSCIQSLKNYNGGKIRLPQKEIDLRLEKHSKTEL